jgi:hypothetical protein
VSRAERRRFQAPKKPTDFLWAPGTWVASEAVSAEIGAEGFTGFEFKPIDLFSDSRCTKRIEGYVELRVTGLIQIDLEKSGMRVLSECPLCGYKKYSRWKREVGLHFVGGPDDWPDVFRMTPGLASINIIQRRFAHFVVERGYRPVGLSRIEDVAP